MVQGLGRLAILGVPGRRSGFDFLDDVLVLAWGLKASGSSKAAVNLPLKSTHTCSKNDSTTKFSTKSCSWWCAFFGV